MASENRNPYDVVEDEINDVREEVQRFHQNALAGCKKKLTKHGIAAILIFTATAFNTGVALIPFPFSDWLLMIGIEVALVGALALNWSIKVKDLKSLAKSLLGAAGAAGVGGLGIFALTVIAKIVAAALKASVVGAPAGMGIDVVTGIISTVIFGTLVSVVFSAFYSLVQERPELQGAIPGENFWRVRIARIRNNLSYRRIVALMRAVVRRDRDGFATQMEELANDEEREMGELLDQIRERGTECSICLGTLNDPVVNAAGNTYCRTCIQDWLQNHNTDPLTGAVLVNMNLTPNHEIRRLVI